MKNHVLFTLLLLLFISGCSSTSTSNCDDEIKSLTNDLGAPEELNKYDSGDYHSHNYWYWSRGFERTFTWGENVDGCETSDYTFTPI